jgi:hypothetical protein
LKLAQPAFLSLFPTGPSWWPDVWPSQARPEAFFLMEQWPSPSSSSRRRRGKSSPNLIFNRICSVSKQKTSRIGVRIFQELLEENPYIRKHPKVRSLLESKASPSSAPPPSPRQYITPRLRPSQRHTRGRGDIAVRVVPDRFYPLEHPSAIAKVPS